MGILQEPELDIQEVEMQLQESASVMQLFEGDTFNMLVVYTDNHTKSLWDLIEDWHVFHACSMHVSSKTYPQRTWL